MPSDIKRYAIMLDKDLEDYPENWHVKRTSDDLDALRAKTQVGKTYRIVPRDDYKATRREGHSYTTLDDVPVEGAIYEMKKK